MFYRLFICGTAIVSVIAATPALAAPAALEIPFLTPAVSDQLLSETTGTGSPFAPLTRRNFAQFVEVQSRNDSRVFGSITVLQMDAWWGTIGSELIANSVRDQL